MSDKVKTMEWLDPSKHEPPLRKKLLLLTRNGVAIIGVWAADALNKAWCPLPNNIFGGPGTTLPPYKELGNPCYSGGFEPD